MFVITNNAHKTIWTFLELVRLLKQSHSPLKIFITILKLSYKHFFFLLFILFIYLKVTYWDSVMCQILMLQIHCWIRYDISLQTGVHWDLCSNFIHCDKHFMEREENHLSWFSLFHQRNKRTPGRDTIWNKVSQVKLGSKKIIY